MEENTSEFSADTHKKIDLSRKGIEIGSLPGELLIDGEQIGANFYQVLFDETGKDGKERGLIISQSSDGKRLASKVFIGEESSIHTPAFPFGLFNLKEASADRLSVIHTHPKTEITAHLKSTTFSDSDLQCFVNGSYRSEVMIDQGGVHLLLRENSQREMGVLPEDIVKRSLAKIASEHGTVKEVMHQMAIELEKYGIRYYFSPTFQIRADGFVEFKDVRKFAAG